MFLGAMEHGGDRRRRGRAVCLRAKRACRRQVDAGVNRKHMSADIECPQTETDDRESPVGLGNSVTHYVLVLHDQFQNLTNLHCERIRLFLQQSVLMTYACVRVSEGTGVRVLVSAHADPVLACTATAGLPTSQCLESEF